MITINNNALRLGNFTSSEISRLMSNGKAKDSKGEPFYSYIAECNYERRSLLPLERETSAYATAWGELVEKYVFDEVLGFEYKETSDETVMHPTINFWAGSADGFKFDEGKTAIDIKCPYTRKAFFDLVACSTAEELRKVSKVGDKYFYQLVSNAIINRCKYAELIAFMPYSKELERIIEMAHEKKDDELQKFGFVAWAREGDLPYINQGGYYNHKHVIRFEVTEEHRQALTARVNEAGALLEPFYKPEQSEVLLAELDPQINAVMVTKG